MRCSSRTGPRSSGRREARERHTRASRIVIENDILLNTDAYGAGGGNRISDEHCRIITLHVDSLTDLASTTLDRSIAEPTSIH